MQTVPCPRIPADLDAYRAAQDVARAVLRDIAGFMTPGSSEASLHTACHELMLKHGASGFWGNTPAFVLAGDRLRLSVFDSSYTPSETPVGPDAMVTIDVGPRIGTIFGDSARTYFLRGGQVVDAETAGTEQAAGMALQRALHADFMKIVTPSMTFAELHGIMAAKIRDAGYENLDLLDAYGHSLATDPADFAIIDAKNAQTFGSVTYFTFEPHIARIGSPLACKYEEVYYFEGDTVRML
jgi:methionyl aminopeptidase